MKVYQTEKTMREPYVFPEAEILEVGLLCGILAGSDGFEKPDVDNDFPGGDEDE